MTEEKVPTFSEVCDLIEEYDDRAETQRFESIGHPAWLEVVKADDVICQRIGKEILHLYRERGGFIERDSTLRDMTVRHILARNVRKALEGEEE